jgi:hypothetical protein
MRFLVLGLILAGCAHQQRSYSLGDDLSVVADGVEVAVRSERMRNVTGKGPLFMMRPRADYAASHCYEGFYNAYEIAHPEYPGGPPQGFLLCKNPEASDAGAFLIGIRSGTDQQQKVRKILFTARAVAGAAEIEVAGRDARKVALPADAPLFAEHPEYVGAMVAFGVWTASANLAR